MSPANAVGVKVKAMGRVPRATVVPPLMAEARVPTLVPVPLAVSVAPLPSVQVVCADTSSLAPAVILTLEPLARPALAPKVRVPALTVVGPS